MGEILGLEEGDPVEVHKALIKMIRYAYNKLVDSPTFQNKPIKNVFPGVQINTREFYFKEPTIVDEITSCYQSTQSDGGVYVVPSIHQANEAQPLHEKVDFYPELKTNCALAEKWNSKNITVHLPVRTNNDIDEVIELLTSKNCIEIIKGTPGIYQPSIDLENNHHNTFFGDLDNCSAFLAKLDDKLDEIGASFLKQNINFCFDSGHYLTQAHLMGYNNRDMLARFFKTQANRIKTLHLHKNDGIGKDQHILLGIEPDANNSIGFTKVEPALLAEHEAILLECLPLLRFLEKDNWNIVLETDKWYTPDLLAHSLKLIYNHL
jgi:sugar phosphate isomerase/epimerase